MPVLLVEAIWRCCNGREARAVSGMSGCVPVLLVEAIWRCCNGREAKAARGPIVTHVRLRSQGRPWDDGGMKCANAAALEWRPFGSVPMGQRTRLSLVK